MYAWDDQFYWVVEAEGLSSRLWRYMIASNDGYITYYACERKEETKHSHHVADIATGVLSIRSGPFVEADIDVDIWCYRYYGES